ncbi:hypothetical protein POM88_034563 [Heracleum sosnowskyi]|uniref:Uncharacterized protein n=1 Tax=Heracleum sosnowskyi TaxID=360622 RepID=A0AAD8HKS7_9APIA|nr:hypothetical protein POM88_055045 [Heracleum sosnowskyi]KAK1368471.1 hypothetical protein POM88_034563 [Heracleum sosnowskyi]
MSEFKISPYTGDWDMSEDWDDHEDQGLNSEERQTVDGLEDGDGDGVQDGDITIYPYPYGEPEFGIILNFKAMIDCPSDDVTFLSSPPDLQAIWVVPSLPYDSLPNYDSPAHNLEAQAQLLQV